MDKCQDRKRARGGIGMITQILDFDAVREWELEKCRSFEEVMQTNLERSIGPEVVRMALERISAMISDRFERTSNTKGEGTWNQ